MPEFLALLLGFTLGMLAEALGRRYDATHASGTGPGAQRGGRTMLKPFRDLTESELVALTDEQITLYCDLQCAEAGVQLLPPDPGPKPLNDAPKPETVLYEVGGFYLHKQDDAARLLAVLHSLSLVQVGNPPGDWYQRIIQGDLPPETIGSATVWTAATWDARKEQVNAVRVAIAAWDAKSNAYNEAAKARSQCCAEIYERLEDARSNKWHRENLLGHFERYLILADGDRTIAARFLRQAYPSSTELVSDEDLGLVVPA